MNYNNTHLHVLKVADQARPLAEGADEDLLRGAPAALAALLAGNQPRVLLLQKVVVHGTGQRDGLGLLVLTLLGRGEALATVAPAAAVGGQAAPDGEALAAVAVQRGGALTVSVAACVCVPRVAQRGLGRLGHRPRGGHVSLSAHEAEHAPRAAGAGGVHGAHARAGIGVGHHVGRQGGAAVVLRAEG